MKNIPPTPLVGTAAALSALIPAAGQVVYETDTHLHKIGDGATAVASLVPFGSDINGNPAVDYRSVGPLVFDTTNPGGEVLAYDPAAAAGDTPLDPPPNSTSFVSDAGSGFPGSIGIGGELRIPFSGTVTKVSTYMTGKTNVTGILARFQRRSFNAGVPFPFSDALNAYYQVEADSNTVDEGDITLNDWTEITWTTNPTVLAGDTVMITGVGSVNSGTIGCWNPAGDSYYTNGILQDLYGSAGNNNSFKEHTMLGYTPAIRVYMTKPTNMFIGDSLCCGVDYGTYGGVSHTVPLSTTAYTGLAYDETANTVTIPNTTLQKTQPVRCTATMGGLTSGTTYYLGAATNGGTATASYKLYTTPFNANADNGATGLIDLTRAAGGDVLAFKLISWWRRKPELNMPAKLAALSTAFGNMANRGISGSTLHDWVTSHWAAYGAPMLPRNVFVWLGHNDAGNFATTGSFATYQANLLTLIDAIRTAGAEPYIILPAPTQDTSVIGGLTKQQIISGYCWICRKVGAKRGVQVVDANAVLADIGNPLTMDDDYYGGGYAHPNDAGYIAVAKAIAGMSIKR